MRIDEFEFRNKQGEEIEPTKDQLVIYIKSLHKQVADLEAKLAESEEKKESYRLQNDEHHLQLLQFYSRLGVEAFGADIHEKALETLMIIKEQLAEKDEEIENLNNRILISQLQAPKE